MLARRDVREMRAHTAAQLQDPEGYLRTIELISRTEQAQFLKPVALRDGRYFERHASPLPAITGVPNTAGGVIVRWRNVTCRHEGRTAPA